MSYFIPIDFDEETAHTDFDPISKCMYLTTYPRYHV